MRHSVVGITSSGGIVDVAHSCSIGFDSSEPSVDSFVVGFVVVAKEILMDSAAAIGWAFAVAAEAKVISLDFVGFVFG